MHRMHLDTWDPPSKRLVNPARGRGARVSALRLVLSRRRGAAVRTWHPVGADHGRLKARLRPMRGIKRLRSAATIAAGHAFVQNLRRGHYELATEPAPHDRHPAAFAKLAGYI